MKTHKVRRNNKNLKKSNNRLRKKLDLFHSETKENLSKICTLEQMNRELNVKNKLFKYSLGAILLLKTVIFIFKDVI